MVSLRGPLARAALAVRRFDMFATTTIRTEDLREGDLPPAGSDWTAYASFALTFDPSQRYRSAEACAELRSEEHTSELQSRPHLVCRLLLEKKKTKDQTPSLRRH